jgi:hypothetical protein
LVDTSVKGMRRGCVRPTGVGGTASRISGMLLLRVTEGAGRNTNIAPPHLRVAPGASTALDFAEDTPARAGEAVTAVMRLSPPTGART